jgi:hypothetical protein
LELQAVQHLSIILLGIKFVPSNHLHPFLPVLMLVVRDLWNPFLILSSGVKVPMAWAGLSEMETGRATVVGRAVGIEVGFVASRRAPLDVWLVLPCCTVAPGPLYLQEEVSSFVTERSNPRERTLNNPPRPLPFQDVVPPFYLVPDPRVPHECAASNISACRLGVVRCPYHS